MNQLVFNNKKGIAVTTSPVVADVFRKDHKSVYRDIQYLPCDSDFYRLNFEHSTYVPQLSIKKHPMWVMTKEGFLFLVSCYNGPKAAKHKESFLSEFNKPVIKTKVMNEIIKITEYDGRKVASARELHYFLESKQEFATWIKNRIKKYELIENEDYVSFDNFIKREIGGSVQIEYALTLDAAKELSMVEGNAKGKQARKYFIECEKELRELSPKPIENDTPELIMARALIVAQTAIESHKEKVKGLEIVLEQKDRRLEIQANEIKQAVPKVQYYEEVMQSESLITTSVIAKELGMGAVTLNKKLHASGIIYLQSGTWLVYAKYQNLGYTKTKTHTYTDSNGNKKTAIQTVWTEKGREFIHKILTPKQVAV